MMESLTETEEFTATELKEIDRCRIYLRVFYISDIASHDRQGIAEWARKGRRYAGWKSLWAWPVQQRPTSWKAWKLALDHLAPEYYVIPQLGDWFEHHHQHSEWYFDAEQITLFHHSNGIWEKHAVNNRARLRFSNQSSACARPVRATHVVETKTRTRFVEITGKCNIIRRPLMDRPPLVPYTTNIVCCIKALPRHIQILVGDIPTLRTPSGWDPTIPVNIIIATDSFKG
jgi:hypothetical protein